MTACAERRPEGPGRPNSAPEVGQGWPIKPRARRGILPFWLVVSSVFQTTKAVLYMRYLYMEQIIVFYCQYRAASHAKQAVLIPKPVLFLLATQCPGVCCPLETIFLVMLKFNCWWETFIPLPKTVEPWLPERSWVLTDDVSFGWDYTSCSQVFSCKQFGDFFLDRWEMFVLHPSTKNPDSCQALLNCIEWWLSCFVWMRLHKLQPGLQLQAIRWLFSRQMRDVCSSILNKKSRQLSSTFEFYWVMTDDVSFEWGYTSCSQVFSCKQFGDFFLDRWEMFAPHPFTKNPDSC